MVGQFRYYLARRQWISAYPEYEEHLQELLYALSGKVTYKKELATTALKSKSRDYYPNASEEKKKSRSIKEMLMNFLHLRR